MTSAPSISVIVPTLGRAVELTRLLQSVERQTVSASEVIVVDRSNDGEVSDMLMSRTWGFNLVRLPTPPVLGTSYAMNQGWPKSTGSHLLFADDDCWYPPWLFARIHELFQKTGVDIVAGRAADAHGRSILGRYEAVSQPITRQNVWTTSIEWMMVFRREVVEAVDGFDPTIGLGASTPWQAAPGQLHRLFRPGPVWLPSRTQHRPTGPNHVQQGSCLRPRHGLRPAAAPLRNKRSRGMGRASAGRCSALCPQGRARTGELLLERGSWPARRLARQRGRL
jgi:glycosyltransferase involved in cell wall biosynthesis